MSGSPRPGKSADRRDAGGGLSEDHSPVAGKYLNAPVQLQLGTVEWGRILQEPHAEVTAQEFLNACFRGQESEFFGGYQELTPRKSANLYLAISATHVGMMICYSLSLK
ncbi:unnamed protein product [[Candida] boidinii]|uniref:Unnamed protein product n=1 Tax=Candida boidinii TaxID=5477 RepID=A0ACB5TI71_CANBO|nr:unnamed protein product [[Candida] boidinii]GME89077.1 unnamed protein product [[Candida] boidinii]